MSHDALTCSSQCGARAMIGAMATSMLDRAIYSYADVDRLVGLHSGTARRWLEGYTRGRMSYEPVLREERTEFDLSGSAQNRT